MTELQKPPLVTFALFAYNQEKYILEAIEGAFAQTYEPLEIILSDDCSTDRTFEIMRRAAASYRGRHTITLNRNPKNLNIGGHVNVVNRLARGELVVIAAGDDVSIPSRTQLLVDAWLASNKQAGLLHSARRAVKENGELFGDFHCDRLEAFDSVESALLGNACVAGATEAWDRNLFDFFGDLRDDLIHEDCALTFRSLLAGRPVNYVDQPLVRYRFEVGVSAVSNNSAPRLDASKRLLTLSRLRTVTEQQMDDLRKIKNPRVASILAATAARQDAAMRFESGWPGPAELCRLITAVGLIYVIRMALKRVINRWTDMRYD